MGRAPLGAAKREKVGGVRLTAQEEEALKRKFGTVSKALRKLLDEHFKEELKK